MRARIAQRGQHRLGKAELALKRRYVTVRDALGHEDPHLTRAIRDRTEHEIHADGRDVEALERDHARRQAALAPLLEHRFASLLRVVEDNASILAARLAVRADNGLQAPAETW